MPELNNKIELKFLKKMSGENNKKEEPKANKSEEKSALKTSNAKSDPKSPVNRVKIAPYAYVEVSREIISFFF